MQNNNMNNNSLYSASTSTLMDKLVLSPLTNNGQHTTKGPGPAVNFKNANEDHNDLERLFDSPSFDPHQERARLKASAAHRVEKTEETRQYQHVKLRYFNKLNMGKARLVYPPAVTNAAAARGNSGSGSSSEESQSPLQQQEQSSSSGSASSVSFHASPDRSPPRTPRRGVEDEDEEEDPAADLPSPPVQAVDELTALQDALGAMSRSNSALLLGGGGGLSRVSSRSSLSSGSGSGSDGSESPRLDPTKRSAPMAIPAARRTPEYQTRGRKYFYHSPRKASVDESRSPSPLPFSPAVDDDAPFFD